jgi:serine protease
MPDKSTDSLERRSFLKATGAAGAAASVGVSTVSAGRDPASTNPDREVICHVKASYDFERGVERITDQFDGEVVNKLPELNAVVVDVGNRTSAAMSQLQSQANTMREVWDVEENGTFEPLDLDANDPQFDDQYAPQQTRADEVWEESLGSEDVSVAVIDTGTDYEHPDLQARFEDNNPGIAPGSPGVDPDDTGKHGTHVAGIVGATTDNGEGVSGMANCRLFAVQALGGRGAFDNVAAGIRWAADQGIDIINMSLGDPRGRQPTIVQQAAQYARDKNVLLIASAGNEGRRDSVLFPAGFEECMAVSALNSNEDIARFSSRGPQVEITGPGAQVLSTVPNGGYERLSGTSMSSPAVAGTAALAKSFNTEISNTELRAAMKETARDVGLSENDQGAGAVDATALVEQIRDGSSPDPDPDPEPEPEPGELEAVIDSPTTAPKVGQTITLDGRSSSSPNGEIVEFRWESPRGSVTGPTAQLSRDEQVDVPITLTITDETGASASTEVTFEFGGEEDDGGNEEVDAVIDVPTKTPEVGQTVTLEGGSSSSPNGQIVEFRWESPRGSATGETVRVARDRATSVPITLTVTDETGASASTEVTLEFGGDGSDCGGDVESSSVTGSFVFWDTSDVYTYPVNTENPCQMEVDLSGPENADFDLYVTFDGRTPTPDDFDKSSEGPGGSEAIIADDIETDQQIGIRVEATDGFGEYELTVEEIGF